MFAMVLIEVKDDAESSVKELTNKNIYVDVFNSKKDALKFIADNN